MSITKLEADVRDQQERIFIQVKDLIEELERVKAQRAKLLIELATENELRSKWEEACLDLKAQLKQSEDALRTLADNGHGTNRVEHIASEALAYAKELGL